MCSQSVPLTAIESEWLFGDEDVRQRIKECRRLLLDAGADPTLSDSTGKDLLDYVGLGSTLVGV